MQVQSSKTMKTVRITTKEAKYQSLKSFKTDKKTADFIKQENLKSITTSDMERTNECIRVYKQIKEKQWAIKSVKLTKRKIYKNLIGATESIEW